MLDSVEVVVASEGGIDDPLEDEGSLKEQMDRLPVIARLEYETVAQHLIALFEHNLAMYQEGVSIQAVTPAVLMQLKAVEGRLTWLTQMTAAIIGSQTASDPRKNQAELLWDGRLSRCVFQLVQMLDYRLSTTAGQGRSDEKLEVAVLTFFRSFKKSYMMDTLTSPVMGGMVGGVPGGAAAHPLLSLALSYAGGVGRGEEKEIGSGECVTVSELVSSSLEQAVARGNKTISILNFLSSGGSLFFSSLNTLPCQFFVYFILLFSRLMPPAF